MKTTKHNRDKSFNQLCNKLADIDSCALITKLLEDLCTPTEIEALADRWAVALELQTGASYRSISETTGVSLATVTRVARYVKQKDSGYTLAINLEPTKQ